MVKWLAAVCVALAGVSAHAQFGVYGMYQGTTLSNITCQDPQGTCSAQNQGPSGTSKTDNVHPLASFGGVYYDFFRLGPVRLGADFRAGEMHSNKSAVFYGGGDGATTAQSFLGGVRGSFHTRYSWLKPYVQASAGWARSDAAVLPPNYTQNPAVNQPRLFNHYVQYEGFAGADVRLLPILDLRAIEVGIGNMNLIGPANGSLTTSIGVRSIGAGIVLHMPQRD